MDTNSSPCPVLQAPVCPSRLTLPFLRSTPQEVALLGCVNGFSPDSGSKWGSLAEGGDGRSGKSRDFVPGSLPAGLPCTHLLPPLTRVTAPARGPFLHSHSVPRSKRGESPTVMSLPLFVDSFLPQVSQFEMLSSSCQNTCPLSPLALVSLGICH